MQNPINILTKGIQGYLRKRHILDLLVSNRKSININLRLQEKII